MPAAPAGRRESQEGRLTTAPPDRAGRVAHHARAAFLALAASLLLACSPAPQSGAPSDAEGSTVLVRGNGPEPDSLDPQKARTIEAHTILRDLYECLTSLAKDASVAPGVAREWEASEDGLTYTFRLRTDARWSNGDPVVAEDFVFALRRLVDPATASQYAQIVDVIENAREIIAGERPPDSLGVAAPDPATVVVRLAGPAPYLPGLMSHPSTCPVHRPTLERHGRDFTRPGVTVSNGASIASTSTTRSRSVTMPTGTRRPSRFSAMTRVPTWYSRISRAASRIPVSGGQKTTSRVQISPIRICILLDFVSRARW